MTTLPLRRSNESRHDSKPLVIVCAWCKQRERNDDRWIPRRTTARDDELSHGICPTCLRRELRRMKGR
jgi:hypothetical protein